MKIASPTIWKGIPFAPSLNQAPLLRFNYNEAMESLHLKHQLLSYIFLTLASLWSVDNTQV